MPLKLSCNVIVSFDCTVSKYNTVLLQKKTRKQREISFQDMCNNVDIFDDGDEDDEDDSDWEPLQKLREIVKWFCTNCTMANLDVAVHCDVCLCSFST